MYQGKFKHDSKHRRRTVVLMVSVLVLVFAIAGGTLAYLSAQSGNVVSTFTVAQVPIEVSRTSDKDHNLTETVRVTNKGDTPAFVRASIVVTWKNAAGDVSSTAPKAGRDYTLEVNGEDWFPLGGFWYCTRQVPAKKDSAFLIKSLTGLGTPPQGYDLSVEVLAQSIQAQGMKDGKPMVESFWAGVQAANGSLTAK